MKFTSFRIQNYRSMIDSGLSKISSDNITVLIGQNEAGKTTVLEALRSFFSGHISDDILRSDNKFPVVSCTFESEDFDSIEEIFRFSLLPDTLRDFIKKKKQFTLTRRWSDLKNNQLYLDEEDILGHFQEQQSQLKKKDEALENNIIAIINQYQEAVQAEALAQRNINKIKTDLSDTKRKIKSLNKSGSDSEQDNYKKLHENQTGIYEALVNELNAKTQVIAETKERYQESVKYNELRQSFEAGNRKLEKELKQLGIYTDLVNRSKSIFDRRKKKRKLYTIRKSIKAIRYQTEDSRKLLAHMKRIITKLFEGKTIIAAESEIKLEDLNEKQVYTPVQLANQLFDHIPEFTFFEDFSSLLPNKIELTDIINKNVQTEGYKAVRNFIRVAGLDESLFEIENQRILKQKIANLNGQITLNFQEYWRQKLGKDNKIHLGFDLEHFDDSNPSKKGQAYLEFWIKDNHERLYPKQRSRGVRWFLSFYLELKSTASLNRQRVLLIDEPGLSLHARAQEDVLKVFEDIKDKVQIIYSTHSPHLIDSDKLYRVLAIQRNFDKGNTSSGVIDIANIRKATADTLTPIYSTMGAVVSNTNESNDKLNLIVEDIANFYLLKSFYKLLQSDEITHILPSTGIGNIPLLANILLGWNSPFRILLPDTEKAYKIRDELLNTVLLNFPNRENKILMAENIESLFDVFSTIDFKKHIIDSRIGITETNTEYILHNDLSMNQLASAFALKVQEGAVLLSDFDFETTNKMRGLLQSITQTIKD